MHVFGGCGCGMNLFVEGIKKWFRVFGPSCSLLCCWECVGGALRVGKSLMMPSGDTLWSCTADSDSSGRQVWWTQRTLRRAWNVRLCQWKLLKLLCQHPGDEWNRVFKGHRQITPQNSLNSMCVIWPQSVHFDVYFSSFLWFSLWSSSWIRLNQLSAQDEWMNELLPVTEHCGWILQ